MSALVIFRVLCFENISISLRDALSERQSDLIFSLAKYILL